MSLRTAETFANDLDKMNVDLEYVEAAVSGDTTIAGNSSQASNKAPVTEESPQFQTNLKAIQTKAKRKKVTADVKIAQAWREREENARRAKAGDIPTDKSIQVHEPTAASEYAPASEDTQASKSKLDTPGILATEPTAKGLTETDKPTTSEPTPIPKQMLTAGPAQSSKITSADEFKNAPTIEHVSATETLLPTKATPAEIPKTTPASEPEPARQATLIKEATPVDESTTIIEPNLESKDTAALEPRPASRPQSISASTPANKTAGKIAPATTAPPVNEPSRQPTPTKENAPVDDPTISAATLESKCTAAIEPLPSNEAQPKSVPTKAKKTTARNNKPAATHHPANEPLPSNEAQLTCGPTTEKTTATKTASATTASSVTDPLQFSEAQSTSAPTTAKKNTASNPTSATTASTVVEPLPASEAQPTSVPTKAKKTTTSKNTPTATILPATELRPSSEAQLSSGLNTAKKTSASRIPSPIADSAATKPLQTSESRSISGPTLTEKTSTTSVTPATTSSPTTDPAPAIEPLISSTPTGGSEEGSPQESAPVESAPTKETLNRQARADSVKFIRSRTNSRSGANTPLIGPIRNIIQSEAVGHLPSPVEIDENPFELDKTPAGPTKEEKGKGVVRDPPVERPKVLVAQPGHAPLDSYASPNEAWDFMFGPELEKNEDEVPSSLAVPEERAVKGSKPTKSPQSQGDSSSTPRPQLSTPNTEPTTAGKKKRKNKKKVSHPERVKKYVQAAKTSARMLGYEAARSAPVDFRKLIRDSDPSSSSAHPGLRGSQATTRSGPPGSSIPPSILGPNASFQSLPWAYATHTAADAQLVRHGIFLFEKIPPIKAPPLQFPEPYHQLTEHPPIIVNHEFVVADAPAVKFTGEPDIPGDTLMHVFPCPNRRPDPRSHPGHPDFVGTSLLLQYQAVEATGQTVWRHDRELLDCRHRKCKKKCSDWNQETILCLGCGPKTHTRYCSLSHQLEDLEGHWPECGTDAMLIKQVIDHNTTPPRFARHCPAIPNLHGYNSLDRYRQRAYAMMTAGQYTLFNDDKPNANIILIWPKSDPRHLEMSARIERILNILLFDHKCELLLHYFWRLIREVMIKTNQWTRNGATSLGSQFVTEFEDEWTDPKAFGRRGDYLRPLCETDWDGDHWHHVHSSACVKYFEQLRSPFGEVMHMSGRGVRQIVVQYEAKYWILRAWRQRHECPYWRQRAENTGTVKVRLLQPYSMFLLSLLALY